MIYNVIMKDGLKIRLFDIISIEKSFSLISFIDINEKEIFCINIDELKYFEEVNK